MNCPTCNYKMTNEIVSEQRGTDILKFYCRVKSCEIVFFSGPHSDVVYYPQISFIKTDDELPLCMQYSFPFCKKNNIYLLNGRAFTHSTIVYPSNNSFETVIKTDYFPIIMENNLSIQSKQLFNRLYKLIPFT